MNGRLYRLTPTGGKPNHYTDSYASVATKLSNSWDRTQLDHLDVGQTFLLLCGTTVERVA